MIYRDFSMSSISGQGKETTKPCRTDKIEIEFPGISRTVRPFGVMVGGVLVSDSKIGRATRARIAVVLGKRYGLSVRQDHPKRVVIVRKAPVVNPPPPDLHVTTSRAGRCFEFRVCYKCGRTVVAAGGYRSRSTARRRGKVVVNALRGLR